MDVVSRVFQEYLDQNVEVVFLGHVVSAVGYYRWFVSGFSRIAAPLTKLFQKNVWFEWTDERQQAFEKLKEALTRASILVQSESSKGSGLGCVFMHDRRVVAYASRQLKIHEHKYSMHDLELVMVVFALNFWRHYLYGEKCTMCIDHKNLNMSQKDLKLRQQRWLELVKDYDFSIEYHPGMANIVVDALSRKVAV
ncbi:hypothetical protein GQ457_03G015340 [Hibiscus cannabinus]